MVLTKVVDSRVSRQSRVAKLGSAIAASSAGTSADISGLRMTLPTCREQGEEGKQRAPGRPGGGVLVEEVEGSCRDVWFGELRDSSVRLFGVGNRGQQCGHKRRHLWTANDTANLYGGKCEARKWRGR